MKRDVADFWNLLWELGLGVCAVFGLLSVFAPPQDLPWTPLDLSRPVGASTGTKVARLDIERGASVEAVEDATEACMAVLRDAGVTVERVPDKDDGGFCIVRGAVKITGGDVTPFSSGQPIMQCPLAIRYVLWDRQVLQPAARATFGSEVARIDDFGTYSCRRIYGSSNAGDRPSEHARANALDVAGVTLSNGRKVSVLADWDGDGPAGRDGAAFLKQVRDGACRVFSTVLGPEYNQAHENHLHLDGAPYSLCAKGPSRRSARKSDSESG